MKERRYDVDWLRVVATLDNSLFHCARFFHTEGWELKNVEQSFIVDALRGCLVLLCVMELFFLTNSRQEPAIVKFVQEQSGPPPGDTPLACPGSGFRTLLLRCARPVMIYR